MTLPSTIGSSGVPRKRRLASAWIFRVSEVCTSRLRELTILMSNWTPRKYSFGAAARETGLSVEASKEPTSVRGLKLARSTVTVPESTLLSEVPIRLTFPLMVTLRPSGVR